MKMAILAGKFIYGSTMELQSRVFLVPWARKIIVRSSSKSTPKSPIRYVPKRSSDNKKLQNSSPPAEVFKNDEFGRLTNPSLSRVSQSNSRRGLFPDDKLQNVYKNKVTFNVESGKADDRLTSVVEMPEMEEEIGCQWRPEESKLVENFDEREVMQLPEEAFDESVAHNAKYKMEQLTVEPSKTREAAWKMTKPKMEKEIVHKWIPEESKHMEELAEHAVFEEPEEGLDELETDNKQYEIGHLPSKEAEKMENSEMEKQINCNRRPEELTFMEELAERGVTEEPQEGLDELEPHNGKYEIEHLTVEASETKKEAEKLVIRLLAGRAFTVLELKKKLQGKKFCPKIVDAVIADFQNRGLINDFLYAEAFSRSRYTLRSWGPRLIKKALVQKGVKEVEAEKAIKLVLKDGASGDDQVSILGFSKPSMDHLLAQAMKQWNRSQDEPYEKRQSRIIGWLQYRGFNWNVINFILKKLVLADDKSGNDKVSRPGLSNPSIDSRLGLPKPSMDDLLVQASKQWLRAGDVPSEKRKSRIIRWLQYRRFNWDAINFILKELQSKYPP